MYFFKPITIKTGWCQAQDAAKIYSGKEGGCYVKLFIWDAETLMTSVKPLHP